MKNRYIAKENEFVTEDYRMTCGSAEAESRVFDKHYSEKSRVTWLVAVQPNAGDNVYASNPDNRPGEGFGGRTLSLKCSDGSTFDLHGGWHGNAESLFRGTGVDVRNKHLTFVVLAKERDYTKDGSMRTILRDVVYRDEVPQIGDFQRWKSLVKQFPEARFYYSQSSGGSCSGPISEKDRV
jgi:hypothetical protein